MSGLEALKEFKGNNNTILVGRVMGKQHYLDCLQVMEKSLKALEIIKKKNVAVAMLKSCGIVERYNIIAFDKECFKNKDYARKLTEEEFNLLKEILGC